MTSDYLTPTRRVATCAGLSQLINWGISFYMPGTFAHAIMLTTGWAPSFIYGGLTLAMLIMAAVSPFTAILYALFIALMTFVSNGTSTHLPELIANFGLPVTVGMLWGMGQTGARLLDVISGQRLTPARLAVITSLLIPLCFLLALTANYAPVAIAGFALGYGGVNGLMTLVKATLPLQLFNPEQYAERTGLLLIPGQLLAAIPPFAWAWLDSHAGIDGTLWFSLSLGVVIAILALALAKCVQLRGQFSERLSSNP